jgi:hypothetical protein
MQIESPWQEPSDGEKDWFAIYHDLEGTPRPFTVVHWRAKRADGYIEADENVIAADTLNAAREALYDTIDRDLVWSEPRWNDSPNLIELWS